MQDRPSLGERTREGQAEFRSRGFKPWKNDSVPPQPQVILKISNTIKNKRRVKKYCKKIHIFPLWFYFNAFKRNLLVTNSFRTMLFVAHVLLVLNLVWSAVWVINFRGGRADGGPVESARFMDLEGWIGIRNGQEGERMCLDGGTVKNREHWPCWSR